MELMPSSESVNRDNTIYNVSTQVNLSPNKLEENQQVSRTISCLSQSFFYGRIAMVTGGRYPGHVGSV